MMEYLQQNPIHFQQELLQVTVELCPECLGSDRHVGVLVAGPTGQHAESFKGVPDALHYLLYLAAKLAASGNPHAWELAHTLTTWVMMATTGTQQVERGRLN